MEHISEVLFSDTYFEDLPKRITKYDLEQYEKYARKNPLQSWEDNY